MKRARPLLVAIGVLVLCQGTAQAWPGDYLGRLRALAVLQTLDADLLAADSATETLRRWCADHRLADPAVIRAIRLRGLDKPADTSVRAALAARPGEVIRYRRVDLVCGTHVLSRADNWYLPARLTTQMNRALDDTDTPFGVVARRLDFHRHTLDVRWLYRPLPEGWDMAEPSTSEPDGPLPIPPEVLQHRAVLTTGAGAPFSVVVETYTGEVLAFRPDR
jgi:hypothetical protein